LCPRHFLKSADVGRIVGEGVIGEANSASVILAEESCDRFLRKAKIGEAFTIGLADELVCPLHHALTFFETLTFIDELFGCIGVTAKNDYVALGGGCSPAVALDFVVMFPSPWRNAVLFGSGLCDVVSPNGARREWVAPESIISSCWRGARCRPSEIFVLGSEFAKASRFLCVLGFESFTALRTGWLAVEGYVIRSDNWLRARRTH
jgi:hypothetical protein